MKPLDAFDPKPVTLRGTYPDYRAFEMLEQFSIPAYIEQEN